MDTLRALAILSTYTNWYPLAEQAIMQYLENPDASLQELREAIDREAERPLDYVTFWTTLQELASDLRPDAH